MIKENNKDKAIKELKEIGLENAFNIIPNLTDKVLDYMENNYNVTEILGNNLEDKRKQNSEIPKELFVFSGISARMKQQHSISELPLALTSEALVNSLGVNIYYDNNTLIKEANIRAFLSRYDENQGDEVVFNNYFIRLFNDFTNELLKKADINCNIHIYDCSILDVNIDNKNYEGSSVAYKGGKNLRGYKIGALVGITSNGGVIEDVCMSTASDHDCKMSEDHILNSPYIKPGDYLLKDRGFLDINNFIKLNKKGINVIVPAKKNMEIYKEAVEMAIQENKWQKHPNSKRKGQEITLVKELQMCWLNEKDKKKKPQNVEIDYHINCCVIRFDIDKNKDVLTDEEVLATDGKYAYAVIMTNDTTISCQDIIRMYEQRPEIEEHFRQLKDFWGINNYYSTKYNIISFVIMCSLIGYNFYQLYLETPEGQEYIGKSFIVEEKHGLYLVKDVKTALVTKRYFGLFEISELLDLYLEIDGEKRQQIKQHLTVKRTNSL